MSGTALAVPLILFSKLFFAKELNGNQKLFFRDPKIQIGHFTAGAIIFIGT
jgi:hypothetical protein